MIEQEQRIAIATFVEPKFKWHLDVQGKVYRYGAHREPFPVYSPDYLHDLNAMREALLKLDKEQRKTFVYKLMLAKQSFDPSLESIGEILFAFELWPEALLRTIGRWRD